MSKKTLKRSLALGALMAFVITGNVWAANMTNQTQADEINENTTKYDVEGAINALESNIVISGNKDATILTINGGAVDAYDAKGVKTSRIVGIGGDFRDTTNESIKIRNIKELNINSSYIGISVGADVNTGFVSLDKPVGKVYIEETVDKTNIKSDSLGIFAGGKNALVQIESKELSIDSNFAVQGNAGATINLGTEKHKIGRLSIVTNDYGLYCSGGSKINVFADTFSLKANEYGIWPKNGTINIGSVENKCGSVNVETNGTNASVFLKNYSGTIGIYGKEVNLINHKEGQNAIWAYSTGTIKIVGEESLYIKGNILGWASKTDIDINTGFDDALAKIEGDIILKANGVPKNDGTINVTLGREGSYLKGSVTKDELAKGSIMLNMNPGTVWDVTGDSIVSAVSGDGATVRVDKFKEAYVKVANGDNATNFTLLGGRSVTDQLDANDPNSSIEKVSSVVDGITFSNYKFEEGSALGEIDAYQEDGVWKFNERTNVTNSNISDVAALGLMAWRSEMNDMNKRLGELRNANGEHGVWVRMVRGETEYEAVKNQYNTYQLGYDEKLSVDKSWTVGMALSYTDGENAFNGGNGESKHKGFAVYGSKLNDDGSFIDLIAKYARLDNDFEVGTEKGDYSTNGYSVSAEYGKRFQQGNGLWIEPQVELTYGQVGSADYMIGKNRAVTQEGMESLVGRIGFSLGKDMKDGNVYARASYLYDFEGETEGSYTDAVGNRRYINDDLGGGWWEVGVGANINLSKATYIYADVEKTFGGEVDTNWQWNLGVRYSF